MEKQPIHDLARPFNPGDVAPFGTVERYLGQGASGFVFLVKQEDAARAVKVYDRWAVAEPGSPERLRRETETLSSLDHPNICHAYTSGSVVDPRDQVTDLHFLVMDYVVGYDLDAIVKREGAFSVERTVHVALAISSALEALHARGIVHRDLKPANIMLEDSTSRVVLMDFGVARNGADDTVTQTGAFLGTTQFAAPEWIYRPPGSNVTSPALDVYSLGATLLYLLSAQLPFPGVRNYAQLLDTIRTQPPTTTYPAIPVWLRSLIISMMNKDPNSRPSLGDVQQALAVQRDAGPQPQLPTSQLTADSVRSSMAARTEVIQRLQNVSRSNQVMHARQEFAEHLRAKWAPFFRELEKGEQGQTTRTLQVNFGSGIAIDRWSHEVALRERFMGFEFDSADSQAVILTPISGVAAGVFYYLAGGPTAFSLVVFAGELRGQPAGAIDIDTSRISSGSLLELKDEITTGIDADGQLLLDRFVRSNP